MERANEVVKISVAHHGNRSEGWDTEAYQWRLRGRDRWKKRDYDKR